MSKKKIIRIACLGVGKHASKNILRVLKNSRKFELVAIHSRSKNLENLSSIYKCKGYKNENSILDD